MTEIWNALALFSTVIQSVPTFLIGPTNAYKNRLDTIIILMIANMKPFLWYRKSTAIPDPYPKTIVSCKYPQSDILFVDIII